MSGQTPVALRRHSLPLTLGASTTPKMTQHRLSSCSGGKNQTTRVRAQHIYQTLPKMGDLNL